MSVPDLLAPPVEQEPVGERYAELKKFSDYAHVKTLCEARLYPEFEPNLRELFKHFGVTDWETIHTLEATIDQIVEMHNYFSSKEDDPAKKQGIKHNQAYNIAKEALEVIGINHSPAKLETPFGIMEVKGPIYTMGDNVFVRLSADGGLEYMTVISLDRILRTGDDKYSFMNTTGDALPLYRLEINPFRSTDGLGWSPHTTNEYLLVDPQIGTVWARWGESRITGKEAPTILFELGKPLADGHKLAVLRVGEQDITNAVRAFEEQYPESVTRIHGFVELVGVNDEAKDQVQTGGTEDQVQTEVQKDQVAAAVGATIIPMPGVGGIETVADFKDAS